MHDICMHYSKDDRKVFYLYFVLCTVSSSDDEKDQKGNVRKGMTRLKGIKEDLHVACLLLMPPLLFLHSSRKKKIENLQLKLHLTVKFLHFNSFLSKRECSLDTPSVTEDSEILQTECLVHHSLEDLL